MHSQILIVGGGAGGLELACKLGRKLGPQAVTLVDSRLFHIWKPSLHEVAAGTLDVHQEGLSYQMLAHDNGFTFVYGPMQALDAAQWQLTVGAIYSGDDGQHEEVLPQRRIGYDSLVLAIGSTSNYFGVPGAAEHTISLNATEDAERFRLTLLKLLTRAELQKSTRPEAGVDIVIIGGGATGVELAAELREASGVYAVYGFRQLLAERDVRITLLEGAPRILEPLPEKVSAAALALLQQRAIQVVTDTRVTAIAADAVTAGDVVYPAQLVVWAAGIKAPDILSQLGLPTTKSGQIEVDAHLAVQGHAGIYALGDCAACAGPDGKLVPPRAQAAHQQADYLVETFMRRQRGKPPQLQPYVYRDYGSLVSVGQSTSVGSLMGSLKGLSWFVDGLVARLMYVSLHLMHHRAVLGTLRTAVLALARFLIKRSTPLVKLH
ncbi:MULTISPECIES: NAD(P)/FAD-dependent oxidoreductase [unclassified Duganella]|uniref:NAD(P)/FAD-dependent oxidoreductase n=1 Tax=unclassified Duganella TaxID=2636909 RepID=UPI000E342B12|nr:MULTISPECIES: NAD(P)/FAD-dependent oxidoreductase [unclassified Duganella]RFP16252.1 NAD(P)/FAD-dependent oxidoreductase [Duganella sp. BJB475]RFP32586.1 NAD(P)/FAD-dependent oxidoreductase [Duganella sp. BJB476]